VKSSAPAPTTSANARRGIASALRSSAAASNHGVCGIALLIEDDQQFKNMHEATTAPAKMPMPSTATQRMVETST
jgi:hypothetical protein